MSEKQAALKSKHGTPEEFAKAVWAAYADLMITFDEASEAIVKYRVEWMLAGESVIVI